MANFVDNNSIVRKIWADVDTILLVFAGSAAEFALNREVNWLFFTEQLPRDPIGRFLSTVRYAQEIVFVDESTAERTINRIRAIHTGVERQRGKTIPEWAYRDVLYMLIDYSERAYELLYRPLTIAERHELYAVFRKLGTLMQIADLPATYEDWQSDRDRHLERDLALSDYTQRLFEQYRRHLGSLRYELLLRLQALLVPGRVRELLQLKPSPMLRSMIPVYRMIDRLDLGGLLQAALIPAPYLETIRQLERFEAA